MFTTLNNLKVTTRLQLNFGLLILIIVGMGLFAIIQMYSLATTTTQLYKSPYTVGMAIREATINLQQMRIQALTAALATDHTTMDATVATINTLKSDNREKFTLIKERFLGDPQEVDALVAQSNQLDQLREEALKTMKTGNREQAIQVLMNGDDAKQFEKVAGHIKNIADDGNKRAGDFMKSAQSQATNSYLWTISLIVMAIILAVWMTITLVRTINRPLIQAVTIANAIATGNLNNEIKVVTHNHETGQILSALNAMQIQLRERFEEDKRITTEINAVTHAASQGDFSKRIHLEHKTGTFKVLGDSINQVLEFNQQAIKDLMRVFAAVAQGDLTQTITNQYTGELAQLKQDANTTIQKLTEVTEEINIVTHAASQGDFGKRIHLENKTGTFKSLGESINQVLEFNQLAIKDLTRVFSAVAQGDLTQTIINHYSGELAQLKQDANTTVRKLTEVTAEINLVTHTASQGDFSKRILLENKTGTFQILGKSINQVLEVNQLAIIDLTRVFSAVAQGDLTQTITNQYAGELARLKQDANTTVLKLTEVTAEINLVTHAAAQGDFGQRIHLQNKTGTFKVLGQSINQVLEFNQLAVKDLMRVFSAVAQGDLTKTITNDYAGELAQLKQDANVTVQKLTEVTEEISAVTHTASQGNFSKRVNLQNKTGTFKIIAESINQVLDSNQQAIKDLMCVFSSVAQGDLTKTIITDYAGELAQLKHDANATVEKLTEVMTVIRQSAEVVSTAASEISQGNANLNQRTTQQASSLEETASSMEQMTGTVQRNADNAKQANQLAVSARGRAEQGNQVVKDAVLAINEIHKSSKKITEIISVIDEIAFQTNLLALNAAVEAARAGEYGRGFAVVATEVRTLAQRSAAAAKEIKTLIQDSNIKVEDGTRLANQSGQALEEIVVAVKKVSDIIAEIAAASSEQSLGIEQVNKAISQMDQMVEQNSILVEQATAASEAMKEQAQALKEQVAFFNMGEVSEVVATPPVKHKPQVEPIVPPAAKLSAKTVVKKREQKVAQAKIAQAKQEWENF